MRSLLFGLLSGVAAGAVLVGLLPGRAAAQGDAQRLGSGVTATDDATAAPAATSGSAALDPAASLHDALRRAERAHLVRVGAWGVTNAAAGTAVALASGREEDPFRHGFGVQTAGWGLVNSGIAAAGLAFGGRGAPPEGAGQALATESRWGQILVVNLGLNAGYMMAGGALLWAGGQGVNRGEELRGHAAAVIVQGLGLFVLDGVAWLGHRERMRGFAELLDGVEMKAWRDGSGGVGVAFSR